MGISLALLFFLNLVVTIIVFLYQKAFLHVSAHFAIISCAVVSLYFTEKVKQKFTSHIVAVILGAVTGFLIILSQYKWKRLGELVLFILNMVFPGATWLKVFKAWLNRLSSMGVDLGIEISVLILFVNIVLGCFFLWAMIYLISLKEKKFAEAVLTLAVLNTLAVGRLYFPWPPVFWGSLIYLGGAVLVGWMAKERDIKSGDLTWLVVLGNLPWWLITIGLGYRILVNPQELIGVANKLDIGALGIPIALVLAILLLALWAMFNSLIQWLIIKGYDKSTSFFSPPTE